MPDHESTPDAVPPSRADLDIELARLALRLGRATAHVMHGVTGLEAREREAALREWFVAVSEDIVDRAHPKHRRYARERIQRLESACSALAAPDARAAGAPAPRRTPGDRRLH